MRLLQEARLPRVPEEQQERAQNEAARHLQDVLDDVAQAQKLFGCVSFRQTPNNAC
jgi:hypothetical protein